MPLAVWGPAALRATLLAILALLLARLVWVSVTPALPLGDYRMAQGQVPAPAIRNVLLGGVDPFDGTSPSGAGAANVTSLDLELFGIRQNLGAGTGGAIIGTPDGQQVSVQVGDDIMPGAKLAAVAFDHVVIDRGGIEERLYLDESTPTTLVGSETATPVAVGAAPTLNAANLDQAIRLSPRTRGTAVTGITVSPGPDSALFSQLGLRPSDVIVQINGVSVTDASDIEQLRRELRPGARLTLGVERGANVQPVVVTIPQ